MCKILVISGIKEEFKDNAWVFVKEMSRQMSAPNSPEDDGVGYAAIDNNGKLFGERWFVNNQAFKHNNTYGSPMNDALMKKFKILTMPKLYNNFGVFNENIKSITLHSRLATNAKELKNNHPFVEDFTSVIHNGVISNDDKLTKKTSTCDSEVILHEYLKLNIRNKIFKVKKLANKLEGYYATGIFSKMDNGTVILDIIKDDRAQLKAYFIKELDTMVFATPKHNGGAVNDTCRILGFTIESELDVKSNKLQRLDAMTGETIGFESFKPKQKIQKFTEQTYHHGYETYNSEYAYDRDYYKPQNNVLQLTTSKEKHLQASLERDLQDIITSEREYSEGEIIELTKKYAPNGFNDNGEGNWSMDERLTWWKREG